MQIVKLFIQCVKIWHFLYFYNFSTCDFSENANFATKFKILDKNFGKYPNKEPNGFTGEDSGREEILYGLMFFVFGKMGD